MTSGVRTPARAATVLEPRRAPKRDESAVPAQPVIRKRFVDYIRIRESEEKYEYAIERDQRWIVRTLGLLGVGSVGLLAVGYVNFIKMNPLLLAIFFLPFLVVLSYLGTASLLQVFFKGFDIDGHRRYVDDFWRLHAEPPVAVVVPAAGEGLEIVAATLAAAVDMDYRNKRVYVLDDTADDRYLPLAVELGCEHVSRPDKGRAKKAGNMNWAREHVAPSRYILVLDADFVPRPEMLREMVPYGRDDVAVIQTPQHFDLNSNVMKRSKIEYGAAWVQREFYRLTQPSRDRFQAAMCVGTNALYNRQLLDAVGGYEGVGAKRDWHHSEDVHTGLKMVNLGGADFIGHRIKFLPVQLAKGLCPSDYYSFFKQQNRWCTGSSQLMFSSKTLLSRVLRPMQKLCYFMNFQSYLYAMTILFAPLQLIALNVGTHHSHWKYTAFFLPQAVLRLVIRPYVLRRRPRPLATSVVVIASAFTYVQAVFLVLIRQPLGWEATGTGTSTDTRFRQLQAAVATYFFVVVIGTLSLMVLNEGFGFRPSVVFQLIFLYACFGQAIHLWFMRGQSAGIEKRITYIGVPLIAVASAIVLVLAFMYHRTYNLEISRDLSFHLVRQ
jgi:cellulose synthase (UDP-forming)